MGNLVLKPYSSSLPVFKKIRKRNSIIENGSTLSYLALDKNAMYISFQELYKQLPNHQSNLVIFGNTLHGQMHVVGVVRSIGSLRSDFNKSVNGQTRWAWCLNYLLDKNYTSLTFQLATEV